MTTFMSIQSAVLTHQKDMVFHAPARIAAIPILGGLLHHQYVRLQVLTRRTRNTDLDEG